MEKVYWSCETYRISADFSHCLDLNLSLNLKGGAIFTDLHIKSTDGHQFLHYKSSHATILAIIFWYFLMFYEVSLSPQVKQIIIISNKHGIYKLPHELLNDLTLTILRVTERLNTYDLTSYWTT